MWEESWEGELIRERCDEFVLHPYAIESAQYILRNIRWGLFLVASQRKSSAFRMKMSILFSVTSVQTLAEDERVVWPESILTMPNKFPWQCKPVGVLWNYHFPILWLALVRVKGWLFQGWSIGWLFRERELDSCKSPWKLAMLMFEPVCLDPRPCSSATESDQGELKKQVQIHSGMHCRC